MGYGRPPASGQFQKGRSGNPRGRPKGSKNIATIFAEAVRKKVKVRENDEIRTISKMEGVIEVAFNKALKGDHQAFAKLIDLAGRLGALQSAEPEQVATPHTSALDILWELAEKRGLLPDQLDKSVSKKQEPNPIVPASDRDIEGTKN